MKIYTGVLMVATTPINGHLLSSDFVFFILQTKPRVPIVINFSGGTVGLVEKYTLHVDNVVCDFLIDTDNILCPEPWFVYPIIEPTLVEERGGLKIIKEGALVSVLLSYSQPTDAFRLIRVKDELDNIS